MYAIVEIGSEQFRVEQGGTVSPQKLAGEAGSQVTFDKVLMIGEGENVTIGQPSVAGASVAGTIVEHYREPKVVVFKKKRRKGYRVTRGHRQPRTKVQIDGITA